MGLGVGGWGISDDGKSSAGVEGVHCPGSSQQKEHSSLTCYITTASCTDILPLFLQEGQQGAAKLQAACVDLAEARRAKEAADEKVAVAEARSRDLYDSNTRLEAHIAGEGPWCNVWIRI